MKNFFLSILLCFPLWNAAQSTNYVLEPQTSTTQTISAQIQAQLHENTSPIPTVSLGENLAQEYPELNYDSTSQKSFWNNFFTILKKIFFKLFAINSEISQDVFITNLKKIGYFLLLSGVILWGSRLVAKYKGRWFFQRNKSLLTDISSIETELLEVNFPEIINKLEQQQNKRYILRMYYLWYLQSLAKAGVIRWEVAKTSTTYAQEIQNATQRSHFERLTTAYTYVWYGNFPLSQEQYQNIKNDFIAQIHA